MYSYAQNSYQVDRMPYNILVINECGIQRNSRSSYMLGRGFEHANLTTTRMDSEKLIYTVCKSNYQKWRKKSGNNNLSWLWFANPALLFMRAHRAQGSVTLPVGLCIPSCLFPDIQWPNAFTFSTIIWNC